MLDYTESQNKPLPYGVRSIRSMRTSKTTPNTRKVEIMNQYENYFAKHVDHLIGRCITYLLVTYPENILEAMLDYFTRLQNNEEIPVDEIAASRPKMDQKILLATKIGPVLTKLIHRMVSARSRTPIEYLIQEITSMLEIENSLESKDQSTQQELEQPAITSPRFKNRPKTAPNFNMDLDSPTTKIPQKRADSTSNLRDEPILPTKDANKPMQITIPPPEEPAAVPVKRKINICLIGGGSSGKTTILNSIQGNVDGNVKPTVGFRPISLALDENVTVNLYDIGGGRKIRDIWSQYYHDIHGLIYVFDASETQSEEFDELKQLFETTRNNNFIANKPLLVYLNKQDIDGAIDATTFEDMISLKQNAKIKFSECTGLGVNQGEEIHPDPRIENSLEWLLNTIQDQFDELNERVHIDTTMKAKEEAKKRLERERKVIKNKIIAAFADIMDPAFLPSDYAPSKGDDGFTEDEGLDFLAGEIGEEKSQLPPIAVQIAGLIGYQRLALQIVGALKSPVSKKKVPMSWEEILAMITDIRGELGLK